MQVLAERQRAFAWWLRTGQLPPVRRDDGLELKFNPYHDPHDGRFTTGPGGSGGGGDGTTATAETSPEPAAQPEPQRGGNSRAFEDPMTLEQAFPGLAGSPGGTMFAVADDVLDITGPANAMMRGILKDRSNGLIVEIKAIDPTWHYDQIVPTDALGHSIETVEGLQRTVDDLRFQRAAVIARVKGDYGPMQVETMRFMQRSADAAYDDGQTLLKAGRLTPRLSDQEALGNSVDQRTRLDLRKFYSRLGIDSARPGPVRVNRRENDTSGTELTYRRPDARVKDVAFDVTLTRKTLGTAQVRGFFNTDFRPSSVVIIRPSQLGADHTYVISRPETKR